MIFLLCVRDFVGNSFGSRDQSFHISEVQIDLHLQYSRGNTGKYCIQISCPLIDQYRKITQCVPKIANGASRGINTKSHLQNIKTHIVPSFENISIVIAPLAFKYTQQCHVSLWLGKNLPSITWKKLWLHSFLRWIQTLTLSVKTGSCDRIPRNVNF